MYDANVSQFLPSPTRLPGQSAAAMGAGQSLAGRWTLGAGRALTLQARQAGVLRITQGCVWATFDNAWQDGSVRGGDYFVGQGESLSLAGGETVVMEACDRHDAPGAGFSWEPAPGAAGMPVLLSAGWRAAMAQSAAELRLGLGLVLRALERLVHGLSGGALSRMPVRGSVAHCLDH